MAIDCTGMWLVLNKFFPHHLKCQWVAAIHFNDSVGSSDHQITKHILHSHHLMPYPSLNFNLWYFLCLNIFVTQKMTPKCLPVLPIFLLKQGPTSQLSLGKQLPWTPNLENLLCCSPHLCLTLRSQMKFVSALDHAPSLSILSMVHISPIK